MKSKILVILSILLIYSITTFSQTQRADVIWGRNTTSTITLDGKMLEPDWVKAESIKVVYGVPGPLPTSGYRAEFQQEAVKDSTHAIVKFLVKGKYLYIGISVPDSSVGGSKDWARWDGFLMSIKDRRNTNRPTNALEFFYTYWYPELPDGVRPPAGAPPRFLGTYGNFNDTARTPSQHEIWEAACYVDGTANDSLRDKSWNVEMRVNLDSLGYNVNKVGGEVVEINFSIWDCDYLYEGILSRISTTRTHIQSPWGNANGDNVLRLMVRNDVTVNSGAAPIVAPDIILPNGANKPDVNVDGYLNDLAWQYAYTWHVAWSDSTVRNSYPGVGPWRSGQWQPQLFGNPIAPVLDPSYGTFKMFFKGTKLYFAADVNDQLIQGTNVYDAMDAVMLLLGDRKANNDANTMIFRSLLMQWGPNGQPQASDYLPTLVDTGAVQWAMRLKQGSTVNNYNDIDSGYVIELAVDLTKLGYPADLGDHILFAGLDLFDGDSFPDSLANYGTRTWWFRENAGGPATPWIYMDPNNLMSIKTTENVIMPNTIKLYGNYPNPFNPATRIGYSIPYAGDVTITFYNVLGKEVAKVLQQGKLAGNNEYQFNAKDLASGAYFYRISVKSSSQIIESKTGKLLLLK